MKALVIGNCQARLFSKALHVLHGRLDVEIAHATSFSKKGYANALKRRIHTFDAVFSQLLSGPRYGPFAPDSIREAVPGVVLFPTIAFNGFHPDCVLLSGALSPTGHYHSSIAIFGFLSGLSVDETVALYRQDVYDALRFEAAWHSSRASLFTALKRSQLDTRSEFFDWCARGCFMHTITHPRSFVLADLAKAALRTARLPFRDIAAEDVLVDTFPLNVVWPVYPEIARRHGARGSYHFKAISTGMDSNPKVYELDEFVAKSFEIYAATSRDALACRRIVDARYADRLQPLLKKPRATATVRKNPYAGLASHQFWRRGITELPASEVDPVVGPAFRVSKNDKIATAGSCFAQHIAAELTKNGCHYYIAEQAPANIENPSAHGYGVFSARFGNLYTTRQLLQLFDRAHGWFNPVDVAWTLDDAFVDPFRPQIQKFQSEKELVADRERHFACVREMFRSLDVFVFTLGLTEGWRSTADGAVFPLAPGVAGGQMDYSRYEFVNFTAIEIASDMKAFIGRLRTINPAARIILTVSPVPLIATYEKKHVLVSTTASKAALRTAAEDVSSSMEDVMYFPSYEIITGNFNRGAYFEKDLRSVTPQGVAHVMRLFMRHCVSGEPGKVEHPLAESSFDQELRRLSAVVCDEEAIERAL